MSPEMILAILDGMCDPRNQGKLTRLDFVNAHTALNALAQYFNAAEKREVAPHEVAKP